MIQSNRESFIGIKRFFEQSYLYYKGRRSIFNAEEFIGYHLFYPLMTMMFYCLIAKYSFQTNDLSSWVIGNSFLLCTNACIFGLGTVFAGERYNGRLRSIIVAPCSKLSLILANGVFPVVIAMASSTIGIVIGAIVFKVNFSNVNLLLTVLTILIAMISATGFGLLLSMYGMISDNLFLMLNIASNILLLFTGAEFPIEQLPKPLRFFSEILPLTRALKVQKTLLNGVESFSVVYIDLCVELAKGALYVLISLCFLKISENQARKNGKFDLY